MILSSFPGNKEDQYHHIIKISITSCVELSNYKKSLTLFPTLLPGTFKVNIYITKKIYCRKMGNAQARKRIRASDFHYLAKFTAFVSCEVITVTIY